MTTFRDKNPRLSRIQAEAADTAVLLQALGHRLAAQGKADHGRALRVMGLDLARVVMALGGGTRFLDMLVHFPTLHTRAGADAVLDEEDLDVPNTG